MKNERNGSRSSAVLLEGGACFSHRMVGKGEEAQLNDEREKFRSEKGILSAAPVYSLFLSVPVDFDYGPVLCGVYYAV